MALNLQARGSGAPALSGGLSVDNFSWWFWLKAGMGFSLGAGIVTVVATIAWAYIVTQLPSLWFVRQFLR